MIHILKGDLLKNDCDVIVQQCNCFAKQGAGLAKQIVKKYPEVLVADKEFSVPVGSKDRLGKYSSYKTKSGLTVVNMYAQYRWGRGVRQTDYDAFEEAFRKVLAEVEGSKVGLPYKIGSDLAGGDWNTVYSIVEKVSEFVGRDVFLYNRG